jgi:hypothetical protein
MENKAEKLVKSDRPNFSLMAKYGLVEGPVEREFMRT